MFAAALLALAALPASAQRRLDPDEQQYYPGDFNWAFRRNYRVADGLFNAFDYGHSILYETLWRRPDAPASLLEDREFRHVTLRVLRNPPRLPLAEGAIERQYVKIAPEAKLMFEWAHALHRQVYDVLADERLSDAEKDRLMTRLLAYYRSRPDLAFSTKPKSMDLMEGQPYSLAFRRKYPKFNGLIWGYHWLQVGLYDALLAGSSPVEKQRNVTAAVGRFWQMLESPPSGMPRVMPMTAAVAPRFTARYPELAIVFDNLHGMHDVISDILASPLVPRGKKRAAILEAGARYRDDETFLISREEWRSMSVGMGIENMGGPAVGFTSALATPTAAASTGHEHHTTPATGDGSAPPPSDSAAVAGTIERFHAALAAGDSLGALGLLAPDATVLESGGIETLAEYRAHHLPADIEFARAVSSVRTPSSVTVRGDAAWARSTSTSQGTFRGREVNSAGVELMVLTRTASGWRISAIHWSARRRQ
ncbi:MAG TPA: nuclear transport factor 2 family protein [Gemmatimonadaceae bacterium]|nr:nuclear transport factor 2 family protein [Gemmatimonadaceae bacterium]